MVLLDLDKAFHTVRHNGLILKLILKTEILLLKLVKNIHRIKPL